MLAREWVAVGGAMPGIRRANGAGRGSLTAFQRTNARFEYTSTHTR
jgi:hypothetical protein